MTRFAGHSVWITGGGSGLGRALAIELAREGADVAVSGRRADRLDETVRAIQALGRRGVAVPCDVTEDGAVRNAVASVVAAFGRLDVAVANAGVGVTGAFEKLTDAEWRHQMEVNLFGVVNTARHALPALRETRGRLVLVASVSGMLCVPGTSAYAASKFAVRGLGLTLAQELYGTGVTCTTIHPGFVETELPKVDNHGHFDPDRPDRRPKGLMWQPERAALRVAGAIYRRDLEFVFTQHGRLGAFVGCHAPGVVHLAMTRLRPASVTAALQGKQDDGA